MKYYDNEPQFTADLTEAAAYGKATGDWTRYKAIERQLAAETALAVLAQATKATKGKTECTTTTDSMNSMVFGRVLTR